MPHYKAAAAAVLVSSVRSLRSHHESSHLHPLTIIPGAFKEVANVTAWLLEASWRDEAPWSLPSVASNRYQTWLPREISALVESQATTPGCGLVQLDIALISGSWSLSLWGANPSPMTGQSGVTVRAVYNTSQTCITSPGIHRPAEDSWRALLRALPMLLGGVPLTTGLDADGLGEVDDAHHSGSGDMRRWFTQQTRSPGGGSHSFTLQLPATPGLGSGGGLPWSRITTSLITQLSPCGAAAGLASLLTPALVTALSSTPPSKGVYLAAGVSVSIGRGDGDATNGTADAGHSTIRLTRTLSTVLHAPRADAKQTAWIAEAVPFKSLLPEVHADSAARLDAGLALCPEPRSVSADDGNGGGASGSAGTMGAVDYDGDDERNHRVYVHMPAAYMLKRSCPASYPLQQLHNIPLVTRLPGSGFGPAAARRARLQRATRQASQRHLGHGVITSTASVRLGASARVRLAFLTPLPWFLGAGGDADDRGRRGGANASHGQARHTYLQATLSQRIDAPATLGNMERAPDVTSLEAITVQAWLSGTNNNNRGGSGRPVLLEAAARTLRTSPGDRVGPSLHVAVVDILWGGAFSARRRAGDDGVIETADNGDPDGEVTVTLTLPYAFPGLMHAEAGCPPDTHRGLDVPGAAVHLVDPEGPEWMEEEDEARARGGTDEMRHFWREHDAWTAPHRIPGPLVALERCFAPHSVLLSDCPPHPWDISGATGTEAHAQSLHVQTARLPPVTVEPPCPDFSMPYNVVVLVCTAAAFVLGTFVNITARKRKPVPAHLAKVPVVERAHGTGEAKGAVSDRGLKDPNAAVPSSS